jgi:anti-anti-sigma factor
MTTELLTLGAAEDGASPDLVADLHHLGSFCVLRLEGHLHAGTLGVLQCQFDRLGHTPCRQVVLDLGALADIDPAGARLLTGLHHYVAGRGGHLTVVGWRPALTLALAGTALRAA